MILIADLQYFSSIISIKILYKFSSTIFPLYENHKKASFCNRCIVTGAGGPIHLSIPLLSGRNQRTPIRELRISGTKWQDDHWKTLCSCYQKSPWFDFYKYDLEPLFRKPCLSLVDWNISCLEWVIEKIGMKLNYSVQNEPLPLTENEVVDSRYQVLPKNYTGYPVTPYQQVFEDRIGFLPNLSILDLLFCLGPATAEYLRSA
jgi:hypothetical protein